MSNKSDFDDCLSSLEITEQLQMYKVPQNCSEYCDISVYSPVYCVAVLIRLILFIILAADGFI